MNNINLNSTKVASDNFSKEAICKTDLDKITSLQQVFGSASATSSEIKKVKHDSFFYTNTSRKMESFDQEIKIREVKEVVQNQTASLFENLLSCLSDEQVPNAEKKLILDFLDKFDKEHGFPVLPNSLSMKDLETIEPILFERLKSFSFSDANESIKEEKIGLDIHEFEDFSTSHFEYSIKAKEIEETTQIISNVKKEKKSSKRQRQLANRKQRSEENKKSKEEALKIDQNQNSNTIKVEEPLKIDAEKTCGFELIPIEKDIELKTNGYNYGLDKTRIAEDFRTDKKPYIAGYNHIWKRLNFFHVMSRYVREKSPFLTNYYIPISYKYQYITSCHYTPESFKGRKSGNDLNFERSHISALSKFMVLNNETNEAFLINGPLSLKYKNIQTEVRRFFNICDIALKSLNAIDFYAEKTIRPYACELLTKVKNEDITVTQSACLFGIRYLNVLNEMQKKFQSADFSIDSSDNYQAAMNAIKEDKIRVMQYLIDMKKAVNDFLDLIQIQQQNKPNYVLFEEV